MTLTDRDVRLIIAHAEEGYPDEVCGIVIGKPGDPGANAVRQCVNVANAYHEEDPIRYPRDARTAYIMDPEGLLRVQLEADTKGLDFLVLYHSHTDHEAYFSRTDRDLALFEEEPLWPGAQYLVVSVRNKKAQDLKFFIWDPLIKDFKNLMDPVSTGR
ncbi:MAG: M67 family metallopeptidase [Candidatus Methylomirabilis oxyfera]|nr:M67 family metallopeptidase [Candidatus Methylomirabilis oxyfera]